MNCYVEETLLEIKSAGYFFTSQKNFRVQTDYEVKKIKMITLATAYAPDAGEKKKSTSAQI